MFFWPALASVSVLEPGFHWVSILLLTVGAAWLGIGGLLLFLFVQYVPGRIFW